MGCKGVMNYSRVKSMFETCDYFESSQSVLDYIIYLTFVIT